MVIRSSDSQGLLLHMPPPMLSGILTPTHTISYVVQNYQTLEQFLESLYIDQCKHYVIHYYKTHSNYNVPHLPVLQNIIIIPLHFGISIPNHVSLNVIDCILKPILQPLFILNLVCITSPLLPDLIFSITSSGMQRLLLASSSQCECPHTIYSWLKVA